jgi:hypothetical protein
MDLTATNAAFKSNTYTFADEVITGATLTSKIYMALGATTGNINQDSFSIRNTAGTTTYAQFLSTGATISGAGLHQLTRTTVGTPGSVESRPALNIQLSRSDQAAPQNNDGTSFRYRLNGSNATNYTVADLGVNYSSSGDNIFQVSLANGDQTGATFSGLNTIQSKISQTVISAGTPSATPGGSSVSAVATFTPTSTTLASGGTGYANLGTTYANFLSGGNAYASLSPGGTSFTVTAINNFIRTGTDNTTKPAILVRYQRTDTTGSNDGDGVDFRLSTGGTSTTNNIARFDAQYRATGLHQVGISVSTDSFAADTDTVYRAQADKTVIRVTPTGTTGTASDMLTVESTKITAGAPVAFPYYTRTQAAALTGALGWQICISDSSGSPSQADDGMMAYWATNGTAQWRYIHNNGTL